MKPCRVGHTFQSYLHSEESSRPSPSSMACELVTLSSELPVMSGPQQGRTYTAHVYTDEMTDGSIMHMQQSKNN